MNDQSTAVLVPFVILDAILVFGSAIWITVIAFKKSLVWGLLTLFFTPVALLFSVLHLRATWKPLLVLVASMTIPLIVMMIYSFSDKRTPEQIAGPPGTSSVHKQTAAH